MSLDFYLYLEDSESGEKVEVLWKNTTHNLAKMARQAGLYQVLWRPTETGFTRAKEIKPTLELGLKDLRQRQEYYEQFNSPNGWGTYHGLVKFVEQVLEGCKRYPSATIHVSV